MGSSATGLAATGIQFELDGEAEIGAPLELKLGVLEVFGNGETVSAAAVAMAATLFMILDFQVYFDFLASHPPAASGAASGLARKQPC